jgi:hypothetical protein
MALELALAIQQEIATRLEEADRLRHRQVERAAYEMDRARHRYLQVDPANRLVASSLEADWNAKLRALSEAQEDYERQRILALATDFPAVWRAPDTPPRAGRIGAAVRCAVGPELARLAERPRIAPIGFDLAAARRVHRREVRVGDDHLMPERFEAAGHPLALGRGLAQDARPGTPAQMFRERRVGRGDPLLHEPAAVRSNAELTCDLVHIEANLLHGWPPLAASDRV